MWIYIATFVAGVLIDICTKVKSKFRTLYVGWLYLFLCFSYTNGSDWRQYELGYEEGYITYVLQGQDLGFVVLLNGLKLFFSDYWVTVGLLKCFYLFSCIQVLKKITENWIFALTLMLPLSLLYMLIDNPLRFMVAMTFLNFAICKILESKYIYVVIYCVIAMLCHSASLFCIVLLPAIKIDFFSRYKSSTLIAIYIILFVLSSSLDNILQLQSMMSDIMENYFGREGLAEHYEAESTESLFTIGTLLNFLLFCVIIKYRRLLEKSGNNLFTTSILYYYVFNIAHVMPTGHRIRMALTFFCCISYVMIMLKYKKLKIVLTAVFCVMLMKNIWSTYSYIPYTNSIPYIFTKHLPYSERSNLNPNNYKLRTGRDLPSEE